LPTEWPSLSRIIHAKEREVTSVIRERVSKRMRILARREERYIGRMAHFCHWVGSVIEETIVASVGALRHTIIAGAGDDTEPEKQLLLRSVSCDRKYSSASHKMLSSPSQPISRHSKAQTSTPMTAFSQANCTNSVSLIPCVVPCAVQLSSHNVLCHRLIRISF
jgi:hypothetical protein